MSLSKKGKRRSRMLLLLLAVIVVICTYMIILIYFNTDNNTQLTSYHHGSNHRLKTENSSKKFINETVTFVRAAIVYFPSKKSLEFNAELQWFLRSWWKMQEYEPESWRTDVIIITTKYTPLMESLNCDKNIRKNRSETGRCIVIDNYVPIIKTHKLINRFADSINSIAQAKLYPGMMFYDWLLRTDFDTFLTPAFGTFKPAKMTVGGGNYSYPFTTINEHRLQRITRDLNLTTQNVYNIGSTWYGPSELVFACAELSVEIMLYMDKWEFTKMDKTPEVDTKNWPEWHYGVLTMYSGQLAINHCTKEKGFEKNYTLLDFTATSTDSIWVHPHLHAWLDDREQFSKTAFFNGEYRYWKKPRSKDLNVLYRVI